MKFWKVLVLLGIACVVLSVAQPEEEPPSSQIDQQPGLVAQPGALGGGFGFCPWNCRRHPWTWRCRRFWGCRRWWGHHPWRGAATDDQSAGVATEEPAFMNEMEGSDLEDAMDSDGMQMMEGSKDEDEDQTDFKRYLFCPWKCRLLGSLMPHHCSKLEGCRRWLKRTRPDKPATKPEEGVVQADADEAATAGVPSPVPVDSAEQGEKEDSMIRRPFPPHFPPPRAWCPLHCRTHPFAPHCRRFRTCRFWLHRPGVHHLGVAAESEGDQQGDDAVAVAVAEQGAQPEAVENQENSEGRPDDDLRRWQFCPWRCRMMGSLMPWRCRRLPACQGVKEPLRPGELPVRPSGPGQMGTEAEGEGEANAVEQAQGLEQENEKDAEGRRRRRDDDDDDRDEDEDRDEFRKFKFCPKKCRVMGRLSHKMAKRCRRIEACERYMKKRGGKHHREMEIETDERVHLERDGVQAAQVQAQTQTEGDKQVATDAEGQDEFSKYNFCPKKCRALALIGHKMPKRCRRLEACERYLEKRTKHQGVKNLPITVKSE